MKIIERKEIDTRRWDELVKKSTSNSFSLSAYLDAVAENWAILVDDDYSKGMVLPFIVRLGQKMIYTPVFFRYAEALNFDFLEEHLSMIKKRFKFGDLLFAQEDQSAGFYYQQIDEAYALNDRAKRTLKKFEKSRLEVKEIAEIERVWSFVRTHLTSKVESLNDKSMLKLRTLVKSLNQEGMLKTKAMYQGDELVGGAFFVITNNKTLYLKSAFTEEAKKQGAMYKILVDEIELALQSNRSFDFGGSRAENVRSFNLNFGSKDVYYSRQKWNNLPFWMKWVIK